MLGIDWGTSNLRAMRYDANGRVLETRERPWGIRRLPEGGFQAALTDIAAGWPKAYMIACGMVGSRQGWREVAYVDAPAGIASLRAGVMKLDTADGRALSIVPGVRDGVGPDVMRGEETQVFGALAGHPELAARAQLILPGTHSKWVDVVDGRITHFRTVMTGELYAVLSQHSILAASLPAAVTEGVGDAFEAGVRAARESGGGGALTRLFSVRVLQLEARLAPAEVPGYLSGLLIGEEWRALLASGWLRSDAPLVLVGDAAQCNRYRRAAVAFDLDPPRSVADASAAGLWRIGAAMAVRDHAITLEST
ncbi:MAG TPA: 2-dehydro-3-deoxygalactonokinase [Rhodanobacteraceae bacterium]|nr:2-dehydro-3-deoxygalactonokinase [Rhodanobacteraceae bacterium]